MKVVKSPNTEKSFLMKTAWFIGTAAWRIHQVLVNPIFISALAIAVVYGLIHIAGISIEIIRGGNILLNIR